MANPLIRKYSKRVNKPLPNKSAGILDDFAVRKVVATKEGSITRTPVDDIDIANKKYVDDQFPVTHASTTGRTTDDHHAQVHTIVSHDTTATGSELNTLTDNSIANTLHRHSELVASDGSPDPAVSVDALGNVGIGTTTPNEFGIGKSLDIEADDFTAIALNPKGSNRYILSVSTTDYLGPGFTIYNVNTETDVFGIKDNGDSYLRGNVGIGTTNPTAKFHIITGDNTTVPFKVAGLNEIGYPVTHFYIDNSNGNVGIGTDSPQNKLDINSDAIRIRTAQTPASASATGTQGMIAWDPNYIYVCTATNTWKRTTLASW